MADLIARTAPLMLAAASNPAVIGIVVLLLTSTDRPLLRAGAFVAGFGAVLALIGVVGLAFFRHSTVTFGPAGGLFAWVDIAIGAGMLAFAVITWVRRDSAADQTGLLERARPAAFFAVGAVFMITDTSAIVALVPLLRDIAVAGVGAFERAAALTLTWIVVIAPIAAPLGICVVAPHRSRRILDSLRRGIDRYGYLIAIAVFAGIGGYLLVRGIGRL